MSDDRKRPDHDSLFWGLALIGFGVLLLLDRFDVASLHDVIGHYWPLFVVGLGVWKMITRSFWSGFSTVLIGVWLQLTTLHLFGFTYRSSWPLLLIVVGAGIVVRTLVDPYRRERRSEEVRHD